MRSKSRIDGYCARLKTMWEAVPDWRFGQLMCNVLGATGRDPFFAEDEELFAAMEQAFAAITGNPSQIVNNYIEGVLRDEQ